MRRFPTLFPRVSFVLILSGAALTLVQCTESGTTSGAEAGAGKTAGGERKTPDGPKVPPFKAETLSGKMLSFPEDFRGKTVLLDFWATWCPPCRAEIPHLVEVHNKYRDQGFEIIGITLDAGRGIADKSVRAFVERYKMKWPQVYDGAGPVANLYGVRGIPAPFLVDGTSGRLLARGDALRDKQLEKTIERYLPTE